MKMLLRNVNVGSANPALQMFPEIFQIVDVRIALGVFARTVVHRLVGESLFAKSLVGMKLVAVNGRTVQNVFLDNWFKCLAFAVRHNLRHHLAFALHHAKNNRFASRATTANAGMTTADIGFVNLDIAKQRPFVINLCHVLADKVCHAPRCLVSHAKLPHQLHCGNAVPRRGEQVERIEPQFQRRATVLEQGSGSRVNVMPAPLAGVGALGLEPKPVGLAVALGADMALAEPDIEQVLQTRFVIGVTVKKFLKRYALSLIHI